VAGICGWKSVAKRLTDIVLAAAALLILWPMLVMVALAIKQETPGPVLFKQPRRGLNGKVFSIFKFRTMYDHKTDVACDEQTTKNDKRVTKVGTVLRRHSLDELPQLLNVLRGEMSLVGPRPHALSTRVDGVLLEDAHPGYVARYGVKPGITGLAQVCGYRGELNSRKKLRARVRVDLLYINRGSLLLDLKILVWTVLCLVRDSRAY
jgi:lipopolysaccharide/colanic/teichoic acid biosynthesis glycosyltransferase